VTPAFAIALLLTLAASPAAAASEDGHGGGLFWQVLNVALLVAVLFYFARKPVLGYLAGRRDEIAKNLESSSELLAESERRLAEWSRKAADLDREAASIRDATRRAAEAERDRILADARVTAERIRQSAGAVAERELRLGRETLRREAADLAVELAAKILREQVNDGDRTRLLDEFIGRVEQKGAR
jgi:F-type H+-transporting ATPase subunit b